MSSRTEFFQSFAHRIDGMKVTAAFVVNHEAIEGDGWSVPVTAIKANYWQLALWRDGKIIGTQELGLFTDDTTMALGDGGQWRVKFLAEAVCNGSDTREFCHYYDEDGDLITVFDSGNIGILRYAEYAAVDAARQAGSLVI